MSKQFYAILANTLTANVTTSFLWFCLTFWAYLETRSVLATALIGGAYMLFVSIVSLVVGSYVDRHKKKHVMVVATAFALLAFLIAGLLYLVVPDGQLLTISGPFFWIFIAIILAGCVVENIRGIALSTVVTIMVDKDKRDRANGMVGTINGVGFMLTSVFSGLAIGFGGMGWALAIASSLIGLSLLHLLLIVRIPEEKPAHDPEMTKKVDIRGAVAAIRSVPGLIGLIFFTTFNNLLGGVFMALMDPYGLSLMSVQAWGVLWGVLSIGFIVGGLFVSSKGLGKAPLKTLLLTNVLLWTISIGFPIHSTIPFLAVGMFLYMCFMPVVEAVEQTVIQRVVPFKKQGRVFGFAQSIESASTPLMAFMIGPIAEFIVMPAMREGGWLRNGIGGWFGVGDVRAIAFIFIVSSLIGLIITILAFRSRSYRVLAQHYKET